MIEWFQLSGPEKKALRKFSRVAIDFEALSKSAGVGQPSMDRLIELELAVEGPTSLHGRTFKLTDHAWELLHKHGS